MTGFLDDLEALVDDLEKAIVSDGYPDKIKTTLAAIRSDIENLGQARQQVATDEVAEKRTAARAVANEAQRLKSPAR